MRIFYSIWFLAVTTRMSEMLVQSMSVRKWILEFSEFTDATLSFIDMESAGHKMLYYNGIPLDMVIPDNCRDRYKMIITSLDTLLPDMSEQERDKMNDFFKDYERCLRSMYGEDE